MSQRSHKGLGKRLLLAVRELGFSKNIDFIDFAGIRKATFYAIIKEDRRPNTQTMHLLEKAGVSGEFLLNGKGKSITTGTDHRPERREFSKTSTERISKLGDLFMQYKKKRADDPQLNDDDFWRIVLKILSDLSTDELRKMRNVINIILGENHDK